MTRQPETTTPEMTDAPVVGATEASKKFLNRLIQGKLDMESSTTVSPVQAMKNGIEAIDLLVDQLEDLRIMMSVIARLASEDNDIRGLAIHAKFIAGSLHSDADGLREQLQNHILAA